MSETGSNLRLIDFVYHSTPGLRVIKKKKKGAAFRVSGVERRDPDLLLRREWNVSQQKSRVERLKAKVEPLLT